MSWWRRRSASSAACLSVVCTGITAHRRSGSRRPRTRRFGDREVRRTARPAATTTVRVVSSRLKRTAHRRRAKPAPASRPTCSSTSSRVRPLPLLAPVAAAQILRSVPRIASRGLHSSPTPLSFHLSPTHFAQKWCGGAFNKSYCYTITFIDS